VRSPGRVANLLAVPRRAGLGIAAAVFVAAALVSAMLLPPAAGAVGAVVRYNGPRSVTEVALTFDDGSNPENCHRLLAILEEKGAPATFFPIAAAMPLDLEFWRLLADAGFPIGNHTMTHPNMATLSEAEQLKQIESAKVEEERITGAPLLQVFRPPYGSWNHATVAAAATAGYPVVLLWDTSDRDTSLRGTPAQMLAAAEAARNGSVILMHCGPNATPWVLGPLIDSLRARGLTLVTVPKLLGLAWQPGPVTVPTTAQILGSLSPMPEASMGGVIVGAAGYTPPSPGASLRPTPGAPQPSPSSGPSVTPSSLPSLASSTAPASASPGGASADIASTAPTASPTSAGRPSTGSMTDVIVLVVMVMLGALALAALAAMTRRRRRSR